jgi:DNA polymerase III alpha subunit (gram-positive type)
MHYYIADTETAGLKPPSLPASGVVQVAWIKVDAQLNILDEKFYLVNPLCPIDPGASNIHGVYAADVQGCAPLHDVLKLEYPATIIGHNISFDLRFLQPHLSEDVKSICTLALARRYIKNSTNHKLGTLVSYLRLPQEEAHNALGDVKMTRHLLQYLMLTNDLSLADIASATQESKVLHHMPFGQYKGSLILSLPDDYIKWLLTKADIAPDLRKSLEHFSKIKKL